MLKRGGRFNPLPSPKQGETGVCKDCGKGIWCFNPLPSPKQGRQLFRERTPVKVVFQSAPLTEARGDLAVLLDKFGLACFNPLPSPKQGGDGPLLIPFRIHPSFNPLPSPKQGETDYHIVDQDGRHKFQSAPLTEARGDARPTRRSTAFLSVSIRSLTEARGDLGRRVLRGQVGRVSIRSPHRSKGDRRYSNGTGARPGFNPLPSPKQGETVAEVQASGALNVSIRSLTEARETTWTPATSCSASMFQSAPLTEARGRHNPTSFKAGDVLVSIRSPHRSKGRHPGLGVLIDPRLVSIRSPHRSKGDAGRYNQRNNKNLHRHMRDSVK